ncbi:DUF3617 domain-containing protein [Sphingosinicella sp.]|uniref:DUF3617 domain-containing protein n=1 Tax=Sphingosinicella sp. TaxID=1917971 RepID=UPI00403792A7
MKKFALLAPGTALLFACSGGPLGGGGVTLQPGMWEMTVQFTTIDMPGAPPGATEAMRAIMGQPQTRSNCMTPEQAANPAGTIGAPEGAAQSAGCQFDPNGYANGTINVRGTCTNPTRGNMQVTMTGSYTATTMEATLNQTMTAPPGTQGPQSIRLEGRMTARRSGDCPAGAAAGNSVG